MHPQLTLIEQEIQSALARVNDLADRYPEEGWKQKPPAGGWSAADCISHLNLTAASLIPVLDSAYEGARSGGGAASGRLRRDLVGWAIWRGVQPGGRMKASTSPAFYPAGDQPRGELLAEFRRLHAELLERLERWSHLPLQRVRVPSPFNNKIRYSVYSAFTILAAHAHRHIDQAERAMGG